MALEGIQGLASAYALFKHIPQAAREQLGVELAIIARDVLAIQQLQVPKKSGFLESGLSIELELAKLRVKVGLLRGGRAAYTFNGRTRNARLGGAFYGRIVNFGRKPGIATIKNGRRKGHSIKIGATRPTYFIEIGREEQAIVAAQVADFWRNVLSRVETGGLQ